MKKFFILWLGCWLLSSTAVAADVFIFDLVKKNPYKKYWNDTIISQVRHNHKNDEHWLKQARGVASPLSATHIGATEYLIGTLCEPHNCGGNILYILINKNRLVALQFTRDFSSGKKPAMSTYGNPSAAEMKYLLDWRKSENN